MAIFDAEFFVAVGQNFFEVAVGGGRIIIAGHVEAAFKEFIQLCCWRVGREGFANFFPKVVGGHYSAGHADNVKGRWHQTMREQMKQRGQ